MMEKPDIHVLDFCDIIAILEPMPPVTRLRDRWGCMYASQKMHMLHWFVEQPTKGGGAYTRSKGNESTRTAYNRLQNTGALMWIAEALGATEEELLEAEGAAIAAGDWRQSSRAFREKIPFDRIIELLEQPAGWVLDEKVVPLLEYDESSGEPFVPDDSSDKLHDILVEERGD